MRISERVLSMVRDEVWRSVWKPERIWLTRIRAGARFGGWFSVVFFWRCFSTRPFHSWLLGLPTISSLECNDCHNRYDARSNGPKATWLVKLLMNDWPKQTFIYAAAFVSFQNGKMKRSLYSTFNFVTTCDVLFHFLFAIPYPKRCCDHDNPHSTVVSYS